MAEEACKAEGALSRMPFWMAQFVHFVYLLLLTGLFWLSATAAWRRRRSPIVAFLLVGATTVMAVVLWFFTYPPVTWVITAGSER
jgi:hypothetical protein